MQPAKQHNIKRQYDIAAYVWPAYTGDEMRSRIFWPEGIGEWETVSKARKKFPEHDIEQRKPRWGYVNEADPRVMEMEIDAAADYGVNVFIYDWYWYDRQPFLEKCLNDGYLRARNNNRVKFYIMWANHQVDYTWDLRNSDVGIENADCLFQGTVDRAGFETVARRMIEKYFHHSSYYKIDGRPVFSIYELHNLIKGLGGVEAAADALSWFRAQVKSAGFPGLHLQAILPLLASFRSEGKIYKLNNLLRHLGFDSGTCYNFTGVTPSLNYEEVVKHLAAGYEQMENLAGVTFVPTVSCGWDNNPRFGELKPLMKHNTPERFRAALAHARDYLDARPRQPPLITVNSWNEWTEGSYLQPDYLNGYGFLEAVKSVFIESGTSGKKDFIPWNLAVPWTAFIGVDLEKCSAADYDAIPQEVPGSNGPISGRTVSLEAGVIDLRKIAGNAEDAALLFAEFDAKDSGEMQIGAAADYFFEFFINGNSAYSTMEKGNGKDSYLPTDHSFNIPVRKGKNMVAIVVLSGQGGWKFICGAVMDTQLSSADSTLEPLP